MNANVIVKYFIYIIIFYIYIIFYINFFLYIIYYILYYYILLIYIILLVFLLDYWVKHSKRKMLCSYFLVSEWFSRFTNNYHEIATFIPSTEKSL